MKEWAQLSVLPELQRVFTAAAEAEEKDASWFYIDGNTGPPPSGRNSLSRIPLSLTRRYVFFLYPGVDGPRECLARVSAVRFFFRFSLQ